MGIYFGRIVGLIVASTMLGVADETKSSQEESIAAIEKLGGKFSDDGKTMDLDGSGVTDSGEAMLKAALPECRITY